MTILFFGDVVGKSGRAGVRKLLPDLKQEYNPDLIIANAENAAHGTGVTTKIVSSLFEYGIDFLTSGNHIYSKPQAEEVFKEFGDKVIRPANFVGDLSGGGYKIVDVGGIPVLIVNLNGQVFMEDQFDGGSIENPFLCLREILSKYTDVKVKILDFHAEATSEKRAMGFFADEKMSLVVGTHTHVQSNDAQILPGGTGYITDLGMVGAKDSVIGVKKQEVLNRFLTDGENGNALKVDESEPHEVGFVLAEIDETTGKCQNINAEVRVVS